MSYPTKAGGYEGANAKPYYIEGMDKHGNAFGKVIGVGINGNTYKTHGVGKTIKDQYNVNTSYRDTQAHWKTHLYPGQGNLHGYSVHNNGTGDYVHREYTGGLSSCTNPKGETSYYNKGSKSHLHEGTKK